MTPGSVRARDTGPVCAGAARGQEQAPHCALPAARGEPESHTEDTNGWGAVAWGGGIGVIHIELIPK